MFLFMRNERVGHQKRERKSIVCQDSERGSLSVKSDNEEEEKGVEDELEKKTREKRKRK